MTITRRTLLKSLVTAGAGLATGGAAYGFLYARHHLEVTEVTVPFPSLPAALDGLRIGLLTDVHRSQWVSDEDLDHAVTRLMSAAPDLIVLGGDYVTWGDRKYIGAAADGLARLSAPHGVFAVLGNHDDDREVPAALRHRGIEVLRDARTRRLIGDAHLDLAGIRFWTRRPADVAAALRGASGPVILLAHDQRRIAEAAALQVPLVLSGHTHGGQVVLPLAGAVAAKKFPTLAGLARRDGSTLFVSRGLGTVYVPVRLNCPPEIAVLTLRTASV